MENWTRTASGLYVPATTNHQHTDYPTAIDLFCGAGGFSLGFLEGGFKIVAACDNDPNATLTYLCNLGAYPVQIHYIEPEDKERLEKAAKKLIEQHGNLYTLVTSGSGYISHHPDLPGVEHYWFGDIRKLRGKDILNTIGIEVGEIDCVIGSPPCQGFSMAGKREVMDPRNSLVFEFARLVLEIKPKTMIMENVPGITTMVTPEGLPVLDAFCHILEDGGFGTYETLKRSLLAPSGVGAALRNTPRTTKSQKEKKQDQKKAEQTLF